MFGCKDDIFHAGSFGCSSPGFRIEIDRIKGVDIFLICFGGDALIRFDPLATGWDGVGPKVNKHTETSFAPPLRAIHYLFPVLHIRFRSGFLCNNTAGCK